MAEAQRVVHRAVLAAEAGFGLARALVAHAHAHIRRERAFALAREDLDDARDGVRAIHRRRSAAHDLDAVHLRQVDRFPRGAASGLRVDPHAVDVHGGEARFGTAHVQAGGGAGAAVARHLDARLALQQVRHVDGATAFDLLAVDQRDIGQHIGQGLRDAGGRDHGIGQAGRAGLRDEHGIRGGTRGLGQHRQRAGQSQRQGCQPETGQTVNHGMGTRNTPLPASPPAYGAKHGALPRVAAGAHSLLVGRYPGWRRSLPALAFPVALRMAARQWLCEAEASAPAS